MLSPTTSCSAINVCQFNPVHQLLAVGSDKVGAIQAYFIIAALPSPQHTHTHTPHHSHMHLHLQHAFPTTNVAHTYNHEYNLMWQSGTNSQCYDVIAYNFPTACDVVCNCNMCMHSVCCFLEVCKNASGRQDYFGLRQLTSQQH